MRELQLEDLMLWTKALERDFAASPVVMSVLRSKTGDRSRAGPRSGAISTAARRRRRRGTSWNSPPSTSWTESSVRVVSPSSSKLQVPENAVVVLGGEDLLYHRLAVRNLAAGLLGGLLDSVEHHVGRLVGVGGVWLDGLVVLRLVSP